MLEAGEYGFLTISDLESAHAWMPTNAFLLDAMQGDRHTVLQGRTK